VSTTVSVIAHLDHDPTQVEADQVHHAHTGQVSILLRLRVAGSSMTVAGPAPVLRALLAAQLAALDQADPERGDRAEVRQPFTPPRPPAAPAPTLAGGGRVKVRLLGTRAETTEALARLRTVITVVSASPPCPCRDSDVLVRVDLEVGLDQAVTP
jgi:hypothetical protein